MIPQRAEEMPPRKIPKIDNRLDWTEKWFKRKKRRQTDTIWLNVPSKYTAIALFLFIENPFNNILRKINYVNKSLQQQIFDFSNFTFWNH